MNHPFHASTWNCSRLNSFLGPRCLPFSVTMSKSSRVMCTLDDSDLTPSLNSSKLRPPESSQSSCW